MSSEKINLKLNILPNALVCTTKCEYKHDDGTLEVLGSNSCVVCVGCGKKCHMQCQKIPQNLVDAVNNVPVNNRHFAYFGQMSYMRIVCDNCANLLNNNVEKDKPACFQSLFEKIASKVFAKKIYEMEEALKMNATNDNVQINTSQSNNSKRKKSEVDDGNDFADLHNSMKNSFKVLLERVEKLDESMKSQNTMYEGKCNDINESIKHVGIVLGSNINAMNEGLGSKIDTAVENINACAAKLEKNENSIENGLQKGFNNLMESAQKWMSPIVTPIRNNNAQNSMRRNVLESNMRLQYDTPKSRRSIDRGGPKIPTENGINENADAFGRAVNRHINFGSVNNEDGNGLRSKTQFRHTNALYIRYVDPSITSDKMVNVIKMNQVLNEAIEKDPLVIEVNRLVKRSLTEEQIAGFKNGVSFRIGCADAIFESLKLKSNWATHWEIRMWDPNFKSTERVRDKNTVDEMVVDENDLNSKPPIPQQKT